MKKHINRNNPGNRGAQNFTDADLFSPLFCRIGGQSENTETGDGNRNKGENRKEGCLHVILLIEIVKCFTQEVEFKRVAGRIGFP